MKTYSSLFFWTALLVSIFSPSEPLPENEAGSICATNDLHEKDLSENPSYPKTLNDFEKKWQIHVEEGGGNMENPPEYILPVVVHIIHENGDENIPDAQVFQAIEFLNDAFANINHYNQNTGEDTQIQFCLAQQNPDKETSNGINRVQSILTNLDMMDDIEMKNLSRWEPKDYINIWVVKDICNSSGNCNVAGYAYLPYTHGSQKDGIVIEASLFGDKPGKTGALIHEMGHYLGLYHTFQGGCTNTNCAIQGDRICDTPPDQSTAPVPCDGSINTCDTDTNSGFSTDQNDQFWNYMDYGDLNCFSAFTSGQIDRMHFSIENLRASLLESIGCLEPCPNDILADFSFSDLDIELGENITFLNNSSFATDFEWEINDVFYSNDQNPTYTFNQTGTFHITLIATGNGENCISKLTKTVEVICNVDANFDIGNLNPELGETVQFSTAFNPNNNYTWSINGDQISSATNFDFPIVTEGIYEVCLDVADGNCTTRRCEKLLVFGTPNKCISPSFSKILEASSGQDIEGHCIATSSSGEIYIAGIQLEELLIITTDFSGNITNSRKFSVPGGVKEIAQLKVDSQGDLVGCGTTLEEKAFFFKNSISSFSMSWQHVYPMESEGVAIIESTGYYHHFVNTPISLDDDLGDYIIVKAEKSTGNVVFMSEPKGYISASDEKLTAVTTDGSNFYITTNFSSFSPGSVDYVGVIKIDEEGEVIWSKRTSGIDQNLVDIHYENDAIYVLGEGNGIIDFAIVYKMNLDGVVEWKNSYSSVEKPKSLNPIEGGFIIQGTTHLKINNDGQQDWRKGYGTSVNDYLKKNQFSSLAGYSFFIQNTQGKIKFFKSDSEGTVGVGCDFEQPLDQISTPNVFVAQFFPSYYHYPLSLPSLGVNQATQEDIFTTTECFGKCNEVCNTFSVNSYGDLDALEVPYCMLALDEELLIAGRRNDRSFIMRMDTVGNILDHWVFNIKIGNEFIQKMARTPNGKIVGYGNGLFTNDESDFYFQFDYLSGEMDWIKEQDMEGIAEFSDIMIDPVNGRVIIVGTQAINAQKYGLTIGLQPWDGLLDLSNSHRYEAEFVEKCIFTTVFKKSDNTVLAAGGISTPNFELSSAYSELPNPFLSSFGGVEYASLSPNEIVEDMYDLYPSIDAARLIKSQKTNGTKARHFIKSEGDFNSFEKMIDFDIDFEEKRAFELISIPNLGGILIAGNGNGGANYLTKISLDGELEWSKEFMVDKPISFSLLGNYVYFTFGTIDQDFTIGRISLDGVVSGGCDFIQDFQPIYQDAFPPTNETHEFKDLEPILPLIQNVFIPSNPSWVLPEYEVLCEIDCTEVCDNQFDDDADGLIDGYDPDCDCKIEEECAPQSYLKCENVPCAFSYDLEDIDFFRGDTLWEHPMSLEGQIPMVGDVDGDCIPDVVIHSGLAVGVLDSRDGQLKYIWQFDDDWDAFFTNSSFVGNIGLADVDLDGMMEIFVSSKYSIVAGTNPRNHLVRIDFNTQSGQLESDIDWATGHTGYFTLRHSLSFADFNGDSRPEIYFGNVIFNAENGNIHAIGNHNLGDPDYWHYQTGSVAADVLSTGDCQNCFGLELVAGNQVYSVSIFSEVFPGFNSMDVVRELPNLPDGYTQLADFDNDGDLDAIVAGLNDNDRAILYVWDIQTETLIGQPVETFFTAGFSNDIGIPSIGDVDGDGRVEIVIPTNHRLTILEDYFDGGGTDWGIAPQTIKASIYTEFAFPYTAAPLFDINGDGASEIFFLDVDEFGILDAELNYLGQVPVNLSSPQQSGAYPVIADINGDGFTEILIKDGNNVLALKMDIPMPKTRQIWNQHNYFITNILDNGVVPKKLQKHHLPADGKLNSFLMQQPVYNQDSLVIFNITEANMAEVYSYCSDGKMNVEIEVCNEGNIEIPMGVPITFYDGNPFDGNAEIIEILKSDTLIEPNDCASFLFEIPAFINTEIYIFFNDNGTNNLPMSLSQDFPNSWMPECDFSNNFKEFVLDLKPPILELGNDTLICGTGVIDLKPGSNFIQYLWQDGSEDSTFTTWLPGLFWVEVTDSCGAVSRDSIVIEMLEPQLVSYDSDTTICLGEGVNLSAISDFKTVQWYPNTLFDCDTCFSNIVFPDTTTQIIVIGTTEDACLNVDTILVEVIELELEFETTKSCDGEPDGTAMVSVDNGLEPFDYQWDVTNENVSLVSNLSPGEYFLTITDARGCVTESSVVIEQTDTENIDFDIQNVSCFGEKDGVIQLSTTDPTLSFSLDGNDFQKTNSFENLGAGTYSIFVLDSNNCITDEEFFIDQPNDLTLKLPEDVTIELGETYQIIPNSTASQNAEFQWIETEYLDCSNCKTPISQPLQSITYQLQITDTTGCQISDDITIFVENPKRIYIPNSFSPNGDGLNDRFHPFGGNEVVQIRVFQIFDRWGNLVFENENFPPNDVTFGWDGTMNGKEMNAAVYVYFAEVEYLNRDIEIRKGDVILVR